MRFRRNLRASGFIVVLAALAGASGWGQEALRLGPHYWPTPNPAFLHGADLDAVLQPTVSGRLESALFGCVRNGGRRFHEGIDLGPVGRDSRNEATDSIFAFDEGIVRYVNRRAGTSSYGNYLVIEHPKIAPGFVSLYAHLREIPDTIQEGVGVRGGQTIAVMGRSAGGYTIPRSRAHLHFELGFWLGPKFQQWFDQQPFGSKNEHGAYNGMNIVGLDVWQLSNALRRGEVADAWEFVMSEQIAVEAFVRETRIPDLLHVNPQLMQNMVFPEKHAGWRIELTWYGLPTRFKALSEAEMSGMDGWLTARPLRPDLLEGKDCLDLVRPAPHGGPGAKLVSLTRRLFVD